MNQKNFELAGALIGAQYTNQAASARHQRENLIKVLLSQVNLTFGSLRFHLASFLSSERQDFLFPCVSVAFLTLDGMIKPLNYS